VSAKLALDVSARVKSLIDVRDGGDRRAAAYTLGLDAERMAGLLSGDWHRFSLDALAALVTGYGVSIAWLLSPSTAGQPAPDRPRERNSTRRKSRGAKPTTAHMLATTIAH
jgi:hypothetical protein